MEKRKEEYWKETNGREEEGKFRDSRDAMLRRCLSKGLFRIRDVRKGAEEEVVLWSVESKLPCVGRRRMRGVAHDKTRCILDPGVKLQSLRWILFFLFALPVPIHGE